MNAVVINALLSKKAELLGEIDRLGEQMDALSQAVDHIDGTLRAFGHGTEARVYARRRRRVGMFQQGEMVRFIFDRLRACGPQTAPQLRDAVIAHKEVDPADLRSCEAIHKRVCKTLQRQEARGTVVRDGESWSTKSSLCGASRVACMHQT